MCVCLQMCVCVCVFAVIIQHAICHKYSRRGALALQCEHLLNTHALCMRASVSYPECEAALFWEPMRLAGGNVCDQPALNGILREESSSESQSLGFDVQEDSETLSFLFPNLLFFYIAVRCWNWSNIFRLISPAPRIENFWHFLGSRTAFTAR